LTHRVLTRSTAGTLAYTIVLALISIHKFNDLTVWPANFQNALIPTIVAVTGQPFGACIQGSLLVLLATGVGSANFAILANLARWPVAQAVLFALSVYGKSNNGSSSGFCVDKFVVLAYFKAADERLFIVFLVGILMGFDGVSSHIQD
jgi:hypothetical protein